MRRMRGDDLTPLSSGGVEYSWESNWSVLLSLGVDHTFRVAMDAVMVELGGW